MTVTRDDLKVIQSEHDNFAKHDVVEYNGRNYIVASHDMEYAEGSDAFLGFLLNLPDKETYVMLAKWSDEDELWIPAIECDESCASGVCNKRVFTNEDVADIETGYAGLLNYLNA